MNSWIFQIIINRFVSILYYPHDFSNLSNLQIINRLTLGSHRHVCKSMGATHVHDNWNCDLVFYFIKFIPLRSDKVNDFDSSITPFYLALFLWFLFTRNSIITYLKVCREFCFDTGKYDCKLWLIILSIIIALQILAGPFYGQSKYWYVKNI